MLVDPQDVTATLYPSSTTVVADGRPLPSKNNFMSDFSGKIVIVTGAGDGIGGAAIRRFATLGAVIVVDIEGVDAITEELTSAGTVAAIFNIVTRYADALAFAIPTQDEFDRAGDMLLKRGYA